MPVYKREGVWYARAQVGGVRVEQSAGAGATQAEAKELETAIRKRLREDRHAKRTGQSLNRTFGEALLHYLQLPETERLRSFQSLKSVASLVRVHLENVHLEQVPEKAEEMTQAFLAECLQPATINRRLALVRRILNLAYRRWKWLAQPLAITLLPENNERHVYPEIELVQELMAHCDEDVRDALLVAFFTGMRQGELLRVNRNPENYVQGNFIKLYSGNKTKKPGRLPISLEIAAIVKRMPLNVSKDKIRYHFERARIAVGRPDVRWNDLRHGFASIVAEAGGDFIDIMKLLRHTSPQSTKRYTHLLDKRLKHVVGKVTRLAAGKRRAEKRVDKPKLVKSA